MAKSTTQVAKSKNSLVRKTGRIKKPLDAVELDAVVSTLRQPNILIYRRIVRTLATRFNYVLIKLQFTKGFFNNSLLIANKPGTKTK